MGKAKWRRDDSFPKTTNSELTKDFSVDKFSMDDIPGYSKFKNACDNTIREQNALIQKSLNTDALHIEDFIPNDLPDLGQNIQAALNRIAKSMEEKMCTELQKQTDELKRQADAAEKRAALAEQESKSAKDEAKASKRQSRISNVIAVIAIVVSILAWLVPRDAVIQCLSSIIS